MSSSGGKLSGLVSKSRSSSRRKQASDASVDSPAEHYDAPSPEDAQNSRNAPFEPLQLPAADVGGRSPAAGSSTPRDRLQNSALAVSPASEPEAEGAGGRAARSSLMRRLMRGSDKRQTVEGHPQGFSEPVVLLSLPPAPFQAPVSERRSRPPAPLPPLPTDAWQGQVIKPRMPAGRPSMTPKLDNTQMRDGAGSPRSRWCMT